MRGPTEREIRAKRRDLIEQWVESLDDVSEVVSALIEADGYEERKLLAALRQGDESEAGYWLAKIVRAYARRATEAELQDWLEHGFWREQDDLKADEAVERLRAEGAL